MARRCRHEKALCTDSRPHKGYRRRRCVCKACGYRWSTIEVPLDYPRGNRESALDVLRARLGANVTDRQLDAIKSFLEAFIDTGDGNGN